MHTLIHWSIQEANHDLFEQLEMYSVKINYLQSHLQHHKARQRCGGQLCLCMKCISLIIFKNKHGLQNWRGNIPEVCLFVVFACVAWALRNLNRLLKVKSGQKIWPKNNHNNLHWALEFPIARPSHAIVPAEVHHSLPPPGLLVFEFFLWDRSLIFKLIPWCFWSLGVEYQNRTSDGQLQTRKLF